MRPSAPSTVLHELLQYRELLWSLTWRDIRVRYKQSLLGIAWAVLLPLSLMLVFTFVFTRAIDASKVLKIGAPYPLYAYCGLVPWAFFSVSLNGCMNSLVSNRSLLTKVYFPREVFPVSCVASSFLDYCIAMTVLFGLMSYFYLTGQWRGYDGNSPLGTIGALLFVPVLVVIQIVLTAGAGMLLATANIFYRDVRQIFSVGIQLLMFVSAVVVPVPRGDSWLATIIRLNPLVPIISGYRSCFLEGRVPPTADVLYALMVSGVALIAGWSCLRRASWRFAECV